MKPKKENKQNFIYNNFQQSLAYLPKLKKYFIFSLVLFLLISLFGFLFPYFFEEEIIRLIEELIMQTQGMDFLELTNFIMFNNMKSSFFALILGIFLGFVPIGVIVVNAYVLGFVANKTVAIEGPLIMWRLLPHGIFEIPAVLLSTALGMKLGFFIFTYKGPNKLKEFKTWLLNSLKVFFLIIIPLLVIAGIIEGILIISLG